MKRLLLGLGVVLGSQSIGFAQESSARPASLGLPRASLGLPRPASESGPQLIPTQHAETALPDLIAPILGAQETTPPSPYNLIDEPKPMPSKAAIGEGKKPEITSQPKVVTPGTSGPIVSSPVPTVVAAEEPLFAMPGNAPPFVNRERFKVTNEYLMWWSSGYRTPTLLTTGPTTSDGILGNSGVSTLFGNQDVGNNLHNGYRLSFEYWFSERWAVDGRFFFLSSAGDSVAFSSDAYSLLARPFTDVNPSRSFSEVIASSGAYSGGIIFQNSTYAWGADLNARRKLYEGCCFNVDGLFGYRYMNLTEQFTITEQSLRTNPTSTTGFVDSNGTIHGASAFDSFRTSNRFNGANIGLSIGFTRGKWDFDLRGTAAFGINQASVDISGGQTVYYTNGNKTTTGGGLLALDSNSGHHTSSHFSVIPEATFNVGYNITPRARIFVGYNIIYWSNVLRPGAQINTTIDSARIPNFGNTNTPLTPAQPNWTANYTNYIAQGLNLGFSFKW